jgi:hypothetical protein
MNGEFKKWSEQTIDIIESYQKQNTGDHIQIMDGMGMLKNSTKKMYTVLIFVFLISFGFDIAIVLYYL